jgi:hypothetical protein
LRALWCPHNCLPRTFVPINLKYAINLSIVHFSTLRGSLRAYAKNTLASVKHRISSHLLALSYISFVFSDTELLSVLGNSSSSEPSIASSNFAMLDITPSEFCWNSLLNGILIFGICCTRCTVPLYFLHRSIQSCICTREKHRNLLVTRGADSCHKEWLQRGDKVFIF